MKKLLISLLTGAILIGIGAGVLFFEVSEFSFSEFNTALKSEKQEMFTLEVNNVIGEASGKTTLSGYINNYFYSYGEIKAVKDETLKKDTFAVDIYYRGECPGAYVNIYDNDGYYDEVTGEHVEGNEKSYDLNIYSNHRTPKQIVDLMAYMCQNKVFVEDFDNFIVEKIVVRAPNPEILDIQIQHSYQSTLN